MERSAAVQHTPNTILSRILQVALGLFVTTSDLPSLPPNHELLSYDCSFDSDCRWTSIGNTMDRWRVARGEPDSLLWLAATGTMQLPREPFVLIEQRGNPVDALGTDEIRCQKGYADLSFVYWAIGSADLEICLTDGNGAKFNCTGMLDSQVMPGKVSLKIPEMQKPFRIMIVPNNSPGVLVIDDIRYDASPCDVSPSNSLVIKGRPLTTDAPLILPWTMKKTTPEITTTSAPRTSTTAESTTVHTTEPPTTTPEVVPEPTITTIAPAAKTFSPLPPHIVNEKKGITSIIPSSTTDLPFELMIYGNRTSPLFDRRTGMIITESTKLLCGFNSEFACQWGAEAGRWAVVDKGGIPSLDDSIADPSLLPSYPAALVLQGTAMLTSDPIRCQTGHGKVLFRYWSNGDILLQVCALGYGIDSKVIECVDQSPPNRHDSHNLAVFNINMSIKESFTLNIVPQWEAGLKNRYLVIDEIAYIGDCRPVHPGVPQTTTEKSTVVTSVPTTPPPTTTQTTTQQTTTTTEEQESTWLPTPGPWIPPVTPPTVYPPRLVTLPPVPTSKPHTKESYTKKTFPHRRIITTSRPVPPTIQTTTRRPRWTIHTTTPVAKHEDYCDRLNCNFDDNACNYLNHGLTKKPWTLRNRGYGYPLTGNSDVRPTTANGQFVSSILDPGDIAILESPKFNSTRSLNVLLFQFYRPSQMTTIRLCLGSRYTNPHRSVSSFIKCPSIIRSVTSKNAFRWNTVHVQLPPGTTHFFLVAHNSDRSENRAAVAIDNIRVAICDPRGYAPEYMEDMTETEQLTDYDFLS